MAEIFTCYLEGDGGDLKLTPLPDGGLKAETTRIVLEGSDFFEIGSDAPSSCNALPAQNATPRFQSNAFQADAA